MTASYISSPQIYDMLGHRYSASPKNSPKMKKRLNNPRGSPTRFEETDDTCSEGDENENVKIQKMEEVLHTKTRSISTISLRSVKKKISSTFRRNSTTNSPMVTRKERRQTETTHAGRKESLQHSPVERLRRGSIMMTNGGSIPDIQSRFRADSAIPIRTFNIYILGCKSVGKTGNFV